MSPHVFAECVDILTSVYGELPVKGSRMNAIKAILSKLRDEDTTKLCHDISSTHRNFPLPEDINKAVAEFKKNYRVRTGKHYDDHETIEAVYTKIDCSFCYDTGILKIRHHNPDGYVQLIRCDCEHGKLNNAKIPKWDGGLHGAFVREALDPKWFNPGIIENDEEDAAGKKIITKVHYWVASIKKAELYWKDLGYEQR